MTAFAYLRKSSIRGSTDPEAETQELAVRHLAERFGDRDLSILSDMDISGTGRYTRKRVAYQALVGAVESGSASVVYSYSLSRLGRSVAELSRFFDLCNAKHVPIRLVADSVDTSTASGRLTANVLASVAQFEAEVTGERVKARIELKRANGEHVGAPAFGSKDGEDLPAVVAAFQQAGSYRGAVRLLNERGIATRLGRPWGLSSVKSVIQRADPTIRAPKRGARVRGSFLLSRLLLCGTCNTPLTGTRQTDRRRPERPVTRIVYECSRGHDVPHTRRSVHENAILPAIIREAVKYAPPRQDELRGADEKRSGLEAKQARILDMFADGTIDRAERERRLAPVAEALHRLQPAHRISWLVPRLSASDFGRYSPAAMNRVLRALFSGVRLDPQTYRPAAFDWRRAEAEYAIAQRDAEAIVAPERL